MREANFSRPKGFQFLLYGPPGTGKTTLASQLPRPVAIANIEGGADFLYHDLDMVQLFDTDPNPVVQLATDLFNWARAIAQGKIKHKSGLPFRSLVIDSVASFRHEHLEQLTEGGFIEQSHYGESQRWFRKALVLLGQSNLVTCWIASFSEEGEKNVRIIRPGGISDTIIDHFYRLTDAIVYMATDSDNRRFCTISSNNLGLRFTPDLLAKDRTGLLPVNMTFDDLDEDGNPPEMAYTYFKEVFAEIKAQKEPGKTKSTKK